jgi:hypothetical protein
MLVEPIRNRKAIIRTFAILHRTVGMPTHEEIEAIGLITRHVADAIMWSRDPHYHMRRETRRSGGSPLSLVCDNQEAYEPAGRLLAIARQLELKAGDLDRYATRSESEVTAEDLRSAAELSRKLAANIMAQIKRIRSLKSGQ